MQITWVHALHPLLAGVGIEDPVMQSIGVVSMTSFMALSELLNGDSAKVLYVLRAFHQAAGEGLLELDRAVREGDGRAVRVIAHRTAMACHLVGEGDTANLMEAVVKASALPVVDPILTQSVNHARAALIDTITATSLYLNQLGDPAPLV